MESPHGKLCFTYQEKGLELMRAAALGRGITSLTSQEVFKIICQ